MHCNIHTKSITKSYYYSNRVSLYVINIRAPDRLSVTIERTKFFFDLLSFSINYKYFYMKPVIKVKEMVMSGTIIINKKGKNIIKLKIISKLKDTLSKL